MTPRWVGSVNGALAVAGAGITAWDVVIAFDADDDDAGAANVALSASLLWLGASTVGAAAVSAEATGAFATLFLPFAPWLGLAMAAVVVSTLAVMWLTDSDVEKWAKHGPFSIDADNRMTHDYEGLNPRDAHAALLDLLQAPRVELKENPLKGEQFPAVEVLVRAPGWSPGQGMLDIRLTGQGQTTPTVRDTRTTRPTRTHIRGMNGGFAGQEEIRPTAIEWLREGRNQQVIGLRYRYPGRFKPTVYRARARHITNDGIVLPTATAEEKQSAPPDHAVDINEDVPGWAYPSQALVTRNGGIDGS